MKKYLRTRRLLLLFGSSILVLCTWWLRSHYVADHVQVWFRPGRQTTLEARTILERGIIAIEAGWTSRAPGGAFGLTHRSFLPRRMPSPGGNRFGVPRAGLSVELSCWAVVTALVVLAGARILYLRRRHRRGAQGACALCGYDLRASCDPCPECGTAIPNPFSEAPS